MPYESYENDDDYIQRLSISDDVIEHLDHSAFAIVGDWNANMKVCNGVISSRFGRYVNDN